MMYDNMLLRKGIYVYIYIWIYICIYEVYVFIYILGILGSTIFGPVVQSYLSVYSMVDSAPWEYVANDDSNSVIIICQFCVLLLMLS
jgi:hypothetical protein